MTTMAKLAVVFGCSPDLTAAFCTTSTVIQLPPGLAPQLAARVMSTAMGLLI